MARSQTLALLLAICISVQECFAGLYHPDTLAGFEIDANGNAIAAPFDTFVATVNLIKKADKLDDEPGAGLLKDALDRLACRDQLTPPERVALAADLLRLRTYAKGPVDAFELLRPYRNDPPPGLGFQVYMLISYALMQRAEPDVQAAFDNAESALIDFKPTAISGLSDAQLRWYLKMERQYGLPLLRIRQSIAKDTSPGAAERLDPLFPPRVKGKSDPVRFVGEEGIFAPGTLAAAEKAKLPPDAIAVVQQLILWNPDDGRLWWLLAELYNAEGDYRAAARSYKLAVDEAKFTATELRRHSSEVLPGAIGLSVAADLGQVAADAARNQFDRFAEVERVQKIRRVGIPLALVLMAVIYWQFREMQRRWRARRLRATLSQPIR